MLKRTVLWAIGFYQRVISPAIPKRCRFYPSCSEYTRQAITRYGLLKGLYLGGKRILKCHPLHPGGFDPLQGKDWEDIGDTDIEKFD